MRGSALTHKTSAVTPPPDLAAHPSAVYTVRIVIDRHITIGGAVPVPRRQHDLATADDISRFIDQLGHALAAPAHLDLVQGDESAQWHITVTLAPTDQATLDALHPSASQLCAAAQHALGLAAIGSQIDPAHTTVRVRAASELLLAFAGEGALWWVATTPSAALQEAIDRLIGQIRQRSATS
jgi:hypothetical protein